MRFATLLSSGETWLTNQYYDWLERYRDAKFKEEEAKWATYILERNGERDRSKQWSASSSGACERKQEFTYMKHKGKSPSLRSKNIFANGDYMHMRHQVAGLMQGYLTDVEVPLSIKELNLRGTSDGVCSDGSIVDFKSINHYGFSNLEGPRPDHVRQLTTYMHIFEAEKGRLVYECKNTQEIKEYLVPYDESIWAKTKISIERMNDDMAAGRLASPISPDDIQCRYCQFSRTCRVTTFEDLL